MSESPKSAGAKSLKYAEDLGVNRTYDQALAARNKLDKILTDLSNARDKKRELESRITDAEMEVASEERGKHPDMSAAGMERHLKVAFANNDLVRELREQLVKVLSDIEGLDYDKTIAEMDIKIFVARLHELGGYLQFLAVIKHSVTAAKPTEPTKPTSEGIW